MVPRHDGLLLSEKLKECFQSLYLFVTFTAYSHCLEDQYVSISKGDAVSRAMKQQHHQAFLPCLPRKTLLAALFFVFLANFTFPTTET